MGVAWGSVTGCDLPSPNILCLYGCILWEVEIGTLVRLTMPCSQSVHARRNPNLLAHDLLCNFTTMPEAGQKQGHQNKHLAYLSASARHPNSSGEPADWFTAHTGGCRGAQQTHTPQFGCPCVGWGRERTFRSLSSSPNGHEICGPDFGVQCLF